MINRRHFLWIGVGIASALSVTLPFWRGRDGPLGATLSDTVRALVDQIVPRDEYPGAIDLDVQVKVMEAIAGNPSLLANIRTTQTWIESRFGAAHDWHAIAAAALAEAPASPQYLFVAWLRGETLRLYYGDPRAWPGLGYPHPPQPLGFLDYRLPPKQTRNDGQAA